MAELTAEARDNLDRARIKLFETWPFFGELAMYLRPILSEATPSACVDAQGRMHINPDFANRANVRDLIFVFAHEAMHIVAGTLRRRPVDADCKRWNCAADIAINHAIIANGISLPRPELIRPLAGSQFAKYRDMTHEEIYYALPEDFAQGTHWCDECPEIEDSVIWRERVLRAQVRQAGKGTTELAIFKATLHPPRRRLLRSIARTLQSELKRRYTWRRPNRRTIASGLFTPSVQGEAPHVVIYLDTSSSMHDEILNDCLSEIAGLVRVIGAKSTLVLGDSQVYFVGNVTAGALARLPMRRGGTDFCVVFERLKRDSITPKVFLGFSDLEGAFPEKPPAYPVYWFTHKGSAPWGNVLRVQMERHSGLSGG